MKKSKTEEKALSDILYGIYEAHRRNYPENSYDSRQMCLMWSTNDPPDIIEDTPPCDDIAEAFDITIEGEDAMELYDMVLDEALSRLIEMKRKQSETSR